LAVIQGTVHLLKRKLQAVVPANEGKQWFETLERHVNRLVQIQQEADSILRSYLGVQEASLSVELDRLWRKMEDAMEMSPGVKTQWNSLKALVAELLPERFTARQLVRLFPFVQGVLGEVRRKANHRDVRLLMEGEKDLSVFIDQGVLGQVMEGLLKNAVENTPDGGTIRVVTEQRGQQILLRVQDSGVGITEENQKFIFEGLFPTQEAELYSSKRPYDFNAGGKGLDLFRMKVYGRRFGFGLSMESRRCAHLPTDRDLCSGRISLCPHCQGPEDCSASGGSTFSVSFPVSGGEI
jgi:signal transduction histidine kinase